MEFQHELIIPNEGFPFKLFLFEGRNGNYVREKHWHTSIEIFAVMEGSLYFYIDELPAEQRRIILLRIEGHSWDEIASRLGVSINTVKTQKSRSYKFLREKLANSSYSVLLTLIFY